MLTFYSMTKNDVIPSVCSHRSCRRHTYVSISTLYYAWLYGQTYGTVLCTEDRIWTIRIASVKWYPYLKSKTWKENHSLWKKKRVTNWLKKICFCIFLSTFNLFTKQDLFYIIEKWKDDLTFIKEIFKLL